MGCESAVLLHFIDNIDLLGIQFIKNNTAFRKHQQKIHLIQSNLILPNCKLWDKQRLDRRKI